MSGQGSAGFCLSSFKAHSSSTALDVAAENDMHTEENTDCSFRKQIVYPHAQTGTGHEEPVKEHPLLLILLFPTHDFAYLH